MQQIEGNALRSRLAFVEQQAGEGGKQRVLDALAADGGTVCRYRVSWT